jgi:hypothetical protein
MRSPGILNPQSLSRMESWKAQTRPLLENRARLWDHFNLEERVTAEDLRKLASDLTSVGALRTFSPAYHAACNRYQYLLRAPSGERRKETQGEMAGKLLEWAFYLDQVQSFSEQKDLQSVLGEYYRGLDTPFDIACQVSRWAGQLRQDLQVESDLFGNALYEFLTLRSEASLLGLRDWLLDDSGKEVETLLDSLGLPNETEFAVVLTSRGEVLSDLRELASLLDRIGFHSNTSLGSLEEMKILLEETSFLTQRIENNPDLRQWLKTSYRGVDTDLGVIETSLRFIQFIEDADISEGLKGVFISHHGPQRLTESRNLVNAAKASLDALKELLQKLEVATHSQTKGLIHQPLSTLMGQVQLALKQPHLMQDWVYYIQFEQEVRDLGLSSFLDDYRKHEFFLWPMDQVLEFGYLSALLKKSIQNDGVRRR